MLSSFNRRHVIVAAQRLVPAALVASGLEHRVALYSTRMKETIPSDINPEVTLARAEDLKKAAKEFVHHRAEHRAEVKKQHEEDAKHWTYPISYVTPEELDRIKKRREELHKKALLGDGVPHDEHIDPAVHFTEADEIKDGAMKIHQEREKIRQQHELDAKHWTYPINYLTPEEIDHLHKYRKGIKKEFSIEDGIEHDEHVDPAIHFVSADEIKDGAMEIHKHREEIRKQHEEDAKHWTYPISYVTAEELEWQKKHRQELREKHRREIDRLHKLFASSDIEHDENVLHPDIHVMTREELELEQKELKARHDAIRDLLYKTKEDYTEHGENVIDTSFHFVPEEELERDAKELKDFKEKMRKLALSDDSDDHSENEIHTDIQDPKVVDLQTPKSENFNRPHA